MKRILWLIMLIIVLPGAINNAQDIEAVLGGTTSSFGFSVIDGNNNKIMRLNGAGNMGLGVLSPNARLHILAEETGLIVQINHTTDYAYSFISIVNREWSKGFALRNNQTETVTFFGNGSATFSGNMGIGTNVPDDSRLAVDGVIKSKEVLVTNNNWPDYVFLETYKLKPLKEVEQFIKVNGHLPDIPSAEYIQSNGLPLSSMQSNLLKKIEELTLYVIEQNKHIDQLQLELNEIKRQISNEKKE